MAAILYILIAAYLFFAVVEKILKHKRLFGVLAALVAMLIFAVLIFLGKEMEFLITVLLALMLVALI